MEVATFSIEKIVISKMFLDLIIGIVGAYIIYKLEKIDRRQDVIEVDIAVIKASIPKRFDDSR